MPRGYLRKLHPELYQIDNPSNSNNGKSSATKQESTMSTVKPALNTTESEHSMKNRLSKIRTTISQATALIKNEHILKLDGSNFTSWENRISIILDGFIDNPEFLHCEGPTLSSDKKICRGILIYSLPEAIQSEIIHLLPCKAIYNNLRQQYHVTTRAGQLSGLEELLNAQMQPDKAPSSFAVRLRSSASKFTQWGGNFGEDLLLGLLLQQGIQDQEMVRTVMSQLENEIANKGRNPSLATCHQKHQGNTLPAKQDEPVVFNQTSVINSPGQNKTYEANNIDPATLRAVIQGMCPNCKTTGHFAWDCWSKRTSNVPSSPMNNNSQFRAYYPIITPPTWSAARPLASRGLQQPKPADYYQPQYPTKLAALVNVCFAELGNDKDLMNLFQAEVASDDKVGGRESVCDTGATHSLTCNKEALYGFCQLTKPLPLSIATKTGNGNSFVTGIEEMVFPGLHGKNVLIKNVFYSPNAIATLISPASILKTGGKMYTQGDNLLFCNSNHIPLLTANFDAQRHSKDKSLLWYKPFGHCGMCRLQNFLKDRIGTDICKHLNNCTDCLIAKSKHWNELLPTKSPMEPMDLVTSNIMGPFNQANINSGHWALTIWDISWTYGECHIIATKADAAAVLQGVVARWEVKCGRKLKVLQINRGGEFWSQGMIYWCSMKGITHEQSLPMHHKQNGIAEHYNRSVADMGQTIL
ncbi:hypothetical protein O181_036605 [Austropuccinia psidii MF-1]|uniref:Integrase catalytic domain-containing protein n=1 Tax=Austropuccinia psidii MF-1 TaxID=1389203 RepID=A0A9Q3D6U0_9BASI|nr:hypothetical protein [Austropuccinia psidii MF-1]